MYSKNKGVFAVLIHRYQPLPTGKVEVFEECEFVDRLRNKHYNSATAIVDLANKKLLKNRTDNDSFDDFAKHIKDSYPEQFTSLMLITGLTDQYYDVEEDVDSPDDDVEVDVSVEDADIVE